MPREMIDFPNSVEHLSILDEKGKLDEELEPDLDAELLTRMHREMVRARRFDERLLQLQRQGSIGTFAPVKGQEAAQIGAVCELSGEDWFVPAFRETAAMLWRGSSMKGMILWNAGLSEGGEIPEDRHDLPIAVPVASQIPHAAGLAFAARFNDESRIVMTFFGDGATSEGDFHEALNFAAVFALPVVFVCQNNGWAISLPREKQTASKTLAQKAIAYGMPGVQVDGNDALAVAVAAREATSRARNGDGPTLIEALTYRLEVHTTADDPTKYRDEDEVKQWEKRDPIPRFQGYLDRKGLLSDDDLEELEDEIEEEIDLAWEEARAALDGLADPGVIFDHIYAVETAALREQREECLGGMEGKEKKRDG